jgi:hypothetical protein
LVKHHVLGCLFIETRLANFPKRRTAMTGKVTKMKSMLRLMKEKVALKTDSFLEFVVGLLVILQIFLVAAHVDGLIEKWHAGYAAPAGALVAVVFIDSVFILLAFVFRFGEDDVEAEEDDSADAPARKQHTSLRTMFSKHITARRHAIESELKTGTGVVRAVGRLLSHIGIVAAGTMYLTYATGKFTHAQGFSYSLIIASALSGKLVILLSDLITWVRCDRVE